MSLTGAAQALGEDVYLLGMKLAVRIRDRSRPHEVARLDIAEGFIGKLSIGTGTGPRIGVQKGPPVG
jgi:hypothetical protein